MTDRLSIGLLLLKRASLYETKECPSNLFHLEMRSLSASEFFQEEKQESYGHNPSFRLETLQDKNIGPDYLSNARVFR
jgi:hypothetical protein